MLLAVGVGDLHGIRLPADQACVVGAARVDRGAARSSARDLVLHVRRLPARGKERERVAGRDCAGARGGTQIESGRDVDGEPQRGIAGCVGERERDARAREGRRGATSRERRGVGRSLHGADRARGGGQRIGRLSARDHEWDFSARRDGGHRRERDQRGPDRYPRRSGGAAAVEDLELIDGRTDRAGLVASRRGIDAGVAARTLAGRRKLKTVWLASAGGGQHHRLARRSGERRSVECERLAQRHIELPAAGGGRECQKTHGS